MPAMSRHPAFAVGSWAVGVVVLAGSLAACGSHSKHGDEPELSSPPPVIPSAPVESSAPPPPSAPPTPVLPSDCSKMLSLGTVEQALGVQLGGTTTYLRAKPVPKSGRTGRVTCGYGVPTATPAAPAGATATPTPTPNGTPLVEVSYITYTDAKTADGRVSLTVKDDSKAATLSQVEVNGLPASVLLGKDWNELVMAYAASTIVVEASPTVLADDKAPTALITMAQAVLAFAGQSPSSAPASPLSSAQ